MHTPAPWSIENGHSIVAVNAKGKRIGAIGDAPYWASYSDEDLANASLVAAAPELLAVLELVRFEFKEALGEDRRSRVLRDKIDAAIKKAKRE